MPTFTALQLPENIQQVSLAQFPSNDFNLPLTACQVKRAIFALGNDYDIKRDFLDQEHATSKISAAIKFGVVSIRQVHYWATLRFKTFANSFSRQLI